MYNYCQRDDFEQQEEINRQIHQLREQQIQIVGRSKLAIKYVNQILNLGKSNSADMGYEQLRIYHKWLSFVLR